MKVIIAALLLICCIAGKAQDIVPVMIQYSYKKLVDTVKTNDPIHGEYMNNRRAEKYFEQEYEKNGQRYVIMWFRPAVTWMKGYAKGNKYFYENKQPLREDLFAWMVKPY